MIDQINKNVYLALVAEQAGNYEDMKMFLEEHILKSKEDVSIDERNLLSIAYKNIFSTKRHCVRTLLAYEMKEKQNETHEYLEYILSYKKKLEGELVDLCESIARFISINLKPYAIDNEAKVFYGKLIGDYYRYIAENIEDNNKNIYSDKSLKAYNEAREIAKNLPVTNHVRLGLALNLSVYYYEVVNNQETGCQIAKEALDLVKKEIDSLDEYDENNTDTFHVIEMLQENLNIWNIESEY
jgi:14-3-3 protein epsilon